MNAQRLINDCHAIVAKQAATPEAAQHILIGVLEGQIRALVARFSPPTLTSELRALQVNVGDIKATLHFMVDDEGDVCPDGVYVRDVDISTVLSDAQMASIVDQANAMKPSLKLQGLIDAAENKWLARKDAEAAHA